MHLHPYLLSPSPDTRFPPAEHALREPNGLLAVGGDLAPQRLLAAYRNGIFPWLNEEQPLLWWSPDPRTVFRSDKIHLSRRFRRNLRTSTWTVRADSMFPLVIDACASTSRRGQDSTWITAHMREAYLTLHRLGYAHSIEVFDDTNLVGGLYGVALGRMFFGESMFSARSGASKIALASLASFLHTHGTPLIDAQVENQHLLNLGAERWPRCDFLANVRRLVAETGLPACWNVLFGEQLARDIA
ncbi:MAG TPA: leucyl/phenylalanyl-tRNA--protein transferase [Xylella sp.]